MLACAYFLPFAFPFVLTISPVEYKYIQRDQPATTLLQEVFIIFSISPGLFLIVRFSFAVMLLFSHYFFFPSPPKVEP